MRIPKPLADLYRAASAQGWRIEVTGGDHIRWLPPGAGRPVYSANSTKDPREFKNVRAKLRRTGLKI